MAYETILYSVDEGVATITLNRPDQLNAFTWTMMEELIDAFDRVDADDAVRVVIVTGAGRAFCAGADLSSGAAAFDVSGVDDSPVRADGTFDYGKQSARDGGGMVTLRIFRCLKPVIAAINGPAVGIGITMTLAMDIRLASQNARIGFIFARRGMVPEAASAFFLPRIVGVSQALEWCYRGNVMPADEAMRGGLVRSVEEPDELLPAAHAIAREIVDNTAPVSIALTRQMMWRGAGLTDPMEAHRVDSRAILNRGRSADTAEGIASFFEKRPPVFPQKVSTDMPDFFPWWDEAQYN